MQIVKSQIHETDDKDSRRLQKITKMTQENEN